MTRDGDRAHQLVRRGVPAALLALVVLLAGCGDDSGGGNETAPTTTGAPATTPAPAAETPAPPDDDPIAGKRVVVLAEEFMLADVMAIGIEPVASTASVVEAGFQGLDEYDTSGIEALPMTTLNIEQLATIDPDTIITLQFWVDRIGDDVLRGMAELIVVPDGLTIDERLAFLGEATGHDDVADHVRAELAEATERAAKAVPDDCVVSLAAIYPGPSPAAFVAGPWELPTSILSTGCALDPDAAVATPDKNGRVFLSLEQLGILDGPMLVLLQSDTVDGEQAAVDEIMANPLWAQLPAVQSDDVVMFDRLGYPGATGQIRFLDEFAALFP
jgi:iron complex transport system substrate-binding protein